MMPVSRYIRNVARVAASLGPTEERGLRVWVGYEIDGDFSGEGFICVDDWSEEKLAEYGVRTFARMDTPRKEKTP
jgi:hypothetical protein